MLGQYLHTYPGQAKERGERMQAMLAPLPKEALSLQPLLLTELKLTCRTILSFKEKIGVPPAVAMLSMVDDDSLDGSFLLFKNRAKFFSGKVISHKTDQLRACTQ